MFRSFAGATLPDVLFSTICRGYYSRSPTVRWRPAEGTTSSRPEAARLMLAPGTFLNDKYLIAGVLGQGGMGSVYRAIIPSLGGKPVAIKEMRVDIKDAPTRDSAVRQFHTEARLLALLNHPGLVDVTDAFSEGDSEYLVMSLVDGKTLDAHLQEAEGFLPVATVLGWMDQLCDVLHYLHTQSPPVIFRDLKPNNVMLDVHQRIRLIDFGIARALVAGSRTATFIRGAGTAGFSPVEQFGNGATDARSDVYALGATLYTLLTGTVPPYATELITGEATLVAPQQINPDVRPELAAVLMRMMGLRREDRYPTVAEVRRALQEVASTGSAVPPTAPALTPPAGPALPPTQPAPPPGSMTELARQLGTPARRPRRGSLASWGWVALAVAALAGGGGLALSGRPAAPPSTVSLSSPPLSSPAPSSPRAPASTVPSATPIEVAASDDLEASLQKAPDGATLHLEPGKYRLAQGLRLEKSLTLTGKARSNTEISARDGSYVLLFDGAGASQLQGLTLRQDGRDGTRRDVVRVVRGTLDAKDCAFTGAKSDHATAGSGVDVKGNARATIVDSEAMRDGEGFTVEGSSRVALTRCSAHDNQVQGIFVGDHGVATIGSCTCSKNQACGIWVMDKASAACHSNRCTHNGEFGLYVAPGAAVSLAAEDGQDVNPQGNLSRGWHRVSNNGSVNGEGVTFSFVPSDSDAAWADYGHETYNNADVSVTVSLRGSRRRHAGAGITFWGTTGQAWAFLAGPDGYTIVKHAGQSTESVFQGRLTPGVMWTLRSNRFDTLHLRVSLTGARAVFLIDNEPVASWRADRIPHGGLVGVIAAAPPEPGGSTVRWVLSSFAVHPH